MYLKDIKKFLLPLSAPGLWPDPLLSLPYNTYFKLGIYFLNIQSSLHRQGACFSNHFVPCCAKHRHYLFDEFIDLK